MEVTLLNECKFLAEPFFAGRWLLLLEGHVSPTHLFKDATFEMVNFIVKTISLDSCQHGKNNTDKIRINEII